MKRLTSTHAPKAVGSYSAATAVGDLIFTSGQLPINPLTGVIDTTDFKQQAMQSLKNVQAILEDNGSDMNHVVKATVYLDAIEDFADFDAVYQTFFRDSFPSRSAFEVAKLPLGARVEVEVIAVKI